MSFSTTGRSASVERATSETKISCSINLDVDPNATAGEHIIDVSTGIGFLDHVGLTSDIAIGTAMLTASCRCSQLLPSMGGCP